MYLYRVIFCLHYHPNHLGSAAWITDKSGFPVQYLHYAPYGEMVANQQAKGYAERFKFTGKEREVLGHGYAFIRGFSSDANQVQALRVENLVRRLLGLPANDGSTHPHPNGVDLNKLPKIK